MSLEYHAQFKKHITLLTFSVIARYVFLCSLTILKVHACLGVWFEPVVARGILFPRASALYKIVRNIIEIFAIYHVGPDMIKSRVKRTKTQKISCDSGKIWIKRTKTQEISCDFGKYWIKRTKTQKISCDSSEIQPKRTKTQQISCPIQKTYHATDFSQ